MRMYVNRKELAEICRQEGSAERRGAEGTSPK